MRRVEALAPRLSGVRILVVEDDPLLLMDLETILTDAGADLVGVCRSVAEALPCVEAEGLAAAVLDFRLGCETATPIARLLAARGTPFMFYTGQVDTEPGLAEWPDRKVVQKPALPRAIVAAVAALIGTRNAGSARAEIVPQDAAVDGR
jgi:DNA-binding response OmpR family regulator